MGKGGEQSVSTGNKKPLKLDHLETEVLRKWAKAYGLKEDKDRKVLLEELVRYYLQVLFFCFVRHAHKCGTIFEYSYK